MKLTPSYIITENVKSGFYKEVLQIEPQSYGEEITYFLTIF